MDLVLVGKLVNTHGLKGEVKVKSDFERKDLIFQIEYYERVNKELRKKLKEYELANDQVKRVSSKIIKEYICEGAKYNVAAIDFGMKENIVRDLLKNKCNVKVFPWNTEAEEIINYKPDGVFLSNGPGNPEDVNEAIELVKKIKGKFPIFGICLGHQIICLAYGAKTYKLKFGHRGGNHPVKNLKTGKIEITSQNHSYAVDEKSLANTELEPTHINLLDNTIEGASCKKDKTFSVQYHPEAAPGPMDSGYLFEQFIEWMED